MDVKAVSADIMKEALTWIEATKNFVVEQAPLFVQELLAYDFWLMTIQLIICGLLTFGIPVLWGIIYLKKDKDGITRLSNLWNSNEEGDFLILTISTVASVFTVLTCFLVSSLNIIPAYIKLLVAPRYYLIERISNFLN